MRAQHDHALRLEARVDGLRVRRALQEEPGADEKNEGERDLNHHEEASQTQAALGRLHGGDEAAARLERRSDSEEHSGHEGGQDRESEDAVVQRQIESERNGNRRLQREQKLRSHPRDEEPGGAAETRKKDAFREELAHQARPGRAQSKTERYLAPPFGRAGEKHVGDVRARDEENEGDDSHEHRGGGVKDAVDERVKPHFRARQEPRGAVALVVFRILLAKRSGQGVELSLRHFDRNPVGEAGFHHEAPGPPSVEAALARVTSRIEMIDHRRGSPELHSDAGDSAAERRGNDADDGVGSPVQVERLSDGLAPAAEPRSPEALADDDDGMCAGASIVLWFESAPGERADAEKSKEVPRNDLPHEVFARAARLIAGDRRVIAGNLRKGIGAVPVVSEVRIRGPAVGVTRGIAQVDLDQRLGLETRLGPKHQGVDRAENRGVEPDAERERNHRYEGEPLGLPQHPGSVSEIAGEVTHRAAPVPSS